MSEGFYESVGFGIPKNLETCAPQTDPKGNFSMDIVAQTPNLQGDTAHHYCSGQDNYYAMPSGSNYSIVLNNHRFLPADARIWIEGRDVGLFRIPGHGRISVERPAGQSLKFSLVNERTDYARMQGVVPGAEENGLVEILFYPQLIPLMGKPNDDDHDEPWIFLNERTGEPISRGQSLAKVSSRNQGTTLSRQISQTRATPLVSGATILKDYSHQVFDRIPALRNDQIDHGLITSLSARLVVRPIDPSVDVVLYSSFHRSGALGRFSDEDLAGLFDHVPPRIDQYVPLPIVAKR